MTLFEAVISSMALRASSQRVYRSMSMAFLRRLPRPLPDCTTLELEGAALAAGEFASVQKLVRLVLLAYARCPEAFRSSHPQKLQAYLERKAPKRVSAPRDPLPLLKAAPRHTRLKPWQRTSLEAVVVLLRSTGLKKSELVELRWDSIEEGVLSVGKRGSFRRISLSAEARAALQMWKDQRPNPSSPYVFVRNPEGDPVLVPSLMRWLKRFSKEVELVERPVTTSAMRSALALRLSKEGVPLHEIQRVLGHKRESSTKEYLDMLNAQGLSMA